MPVSVKTDEVVAIDVSCTSDALSVVLNDGRTVSVPLAWFPRLLRATPRQRKQLGLIGGGTGLHWEAIDEDSSVASLFSLTASCDSRKRTSSVVQARAAAAQVDKPPRRSCLSAFR